MGWRTSILAELSTAGPRHTVHPLLFLLMSGTLTRLGPSLVSGVLSLGNGGGGDRSQTRTGAAGTLLRCVGWGDTSRGSAAGPSLWH